MLITFLLLKMFNQQRRKRKVTKTKEEIKRSYNFTLLQGKFEDPSIYVIDKFIKNDRNVLKQIFREMCNEHGTCYSLKIFEYFFQNGVNSNEEDLYKTSLFSKVCRRIKNKEIITLFVKNGADPNKQNIYGQTPFHFYCLHCNDDKKISIDYFIKLGGDPHKKNNNGQTPLNILYDELY